MWPTIRTVGSQETKRWGRIWATRLPRDQSLCMLSPSSQAPDQPLLQLSAPGDPGHSPGQHCTEGLKEVTSEL